VHDLVPHRYNLEVGSPGVERPLNKLADFQRFVGLKAKLKLQVAVAGQKVLVGVLGAPIGEQLFLKDGSRTFETAFSNIVSAHLVFEYGPGVATAAAKGAAAKAKAAKPAEKTDKSVSKRASGGKV
jgi:ribosome maturation factor RimP